jgi:hypothetical protein
MSHTTGMHRLALVLLLAACGSKDTTAPTVASGSGSGSAYEALGKKPANARRAAPPPGIEAKALAVGATAPTVELVDATGTPWTLANALTKHARVMLVFYRGDW